jgi:SAM-dependent methyltransferase
LLILPFVRGRCLEIGCGYRKTSQDAIAVDLVPKGERGRHGNVSGRLSQADVAADGGLLPFRDAAFDSLIARHNLEHYVDTAATLEEWGRVLVAGGTLAVILPDEEAYPGRTVELDPTHYHGYSPGSLARLVGLVGGFDTIETRRAVPAWSFLLTARRCAD